MSMSKFATQADYWKDRSEKAEAECVHLRMQIGYIAAELQIAGDRRSTPEIVEAAAEATAPLPQRRSLTE